jgi:hypothetical protein
VLPGLTADQYFERLGESLHSLREPSLPEESIASLFQTPRPDDLERLSITHQTYASPPPEYDISLAAFIQFMKRDHLVFTGFEPGAPDTVRVTVIFRNIRYDHLHLLQLSWPVADVGSGRHISLSGLFFSYIRWDNVRQLFADPKPD